jgi:hypothetical protein
MQRDSHHQPWPVGVLRLQYLVDLVGDECSELLPAHLARHDHRDVSELLRIGHGPERLSRV